MHKQFFIATAVVGALFICGNLAIAQPSTLPSTEALTPTQAPVSVSLEVRSGRAWEGLIDSRSTDEHLVLRFEKGNAQLRRSIMWSDIQVVHLAGRRVTTNDLKRQLSTLATPARSYSERAEVNSSSPSPSDLPAMPETRVVATPGSQSTPVTSLAVDALLANWDADVEADGLVIHLQPLDAWQQLNPASGLLEVQLYALQSRTFQHAPLSGGRSVEPVGRWTQTVNASDFTTRGAVIRFPFQAAHPEFNDNLGAYGLVHIKYSVPGSGVFEQSLDGVRIRPWAPLRDYLQLDTGRRFLPHENTGRSKTAWPNNYP